MSTDQFPDEMSFDPKPHQKSMMDIIRSGPEQVELVWTGEPTRGKMFMQMVDHLRGDAASKFKVFIVDEQTLLKDLVPLSWSSADWRQSLDRTKREKSDVQGLIMDSMGWSGVSDHHISEGHGLVIHDEACPLCAMGHRATMSPSFSEKTQDVVRELTAMEDARWLKTAVEVKPKNAPRGPQRKGRGGKTRRW